MTKADVMSGFKTIKICTSYKIDGKICDELPFSDDAILNLFIPSWKVGKKI